MDVKMVPTKSNLLTAKNTLKMARLGYDLMDRKRSVLIAEIMELNKRAKALQSEIDKTFSEAYGALQNANIEMGIANVWRIGFNIPKDDGVRIRDRSVMGVLIPLVALEPSDTDKEDLSAPPFALINTSAALDVALIHFKRVKTLIVDLSMVENAAYRLAVAIKKSRKRANALKNIMIPRYEELVKSITETLEERDRDDFTRLKVIKGKL